MNDKEVKEEVFQLIKDFPRHEIKETSYLGVVMLAAIMRLHEVFG
jgi:hypothetical protein